jgi:HD-GYP domain-containing protein (c-di-GMP phosphodiesterase class II)
VAGERIIAVCDSYHAMTSDRAYRSALSTEAARAELVAGAGTQFDPEVVDAFLRCVLAPPKVPARALDRLSSVE